MSGAFARDGERLSLADVDLILSSGLLIAGETIGRFDAGCGVEWIALLAGARPLYVPKVEGRAFAASVAEFPALPDFEFPEAFALEEVRVEPRPVLRIRGDEDRRSRARTVDAEFAISYDGRVVSPGSPASGVYDAADHRRIVRDREAERLAGQRLRELGLGLGQRADGEDSLALKLNKSRVPEVVRTLVAEGWHVEARGKLLRPPGAARLSVASGIDWFELHGGGVVRRPDSTTAGTAGRGEAGGVLGGAGRWHAGDAPRGVAREVRSRGGAWERRRATTFALHGARRPCWTRCSLHCRRFRRTGSSPV